MRFSPTAIMSDRYSKSTKRGALISISAVAFLLFAFGVIAQNVFAGRRSRSIRVSFLRCAIRPTHRLPSALHGFKRQRAT